MLNNMPEEVKERFVLDLTKVILAFYEDEQHRQEFEEWRKKRHDASAD